MESILRQTFTSYEIVLLVDGSPDLCDMICDEYALKYSCIRVVHKQNEGLMMTRRRGFQLAEGEYFICLDSDDYLHDCRALEKIHDIIVNEKCDLVLYDYIHGGSGEQKDRRISLFDYPSGYVFLEKELVYERLLT
ncbi:MAG: glycosyltransferase family 2 protein, partial [Frisingicoccus sp.]|uniref:glycosyltransferase family 2 protein n=1 Tax=Frisingicoccus sp. TaxID=1918627 RepID=UPI00260E4779